MPNRSPISGRRCLLSLLKICALSLLAMPAATRAESNCPWMNVATASDLVGATVAGAYVEGSGYSHLCTFTAQSGQAERTLQITVEDSSNAHADYILDRQKSCLSAPEPLMAVGNEAVTCSILQRKTVTGKRALGRVRNQVFVISLSTSVRNDPILTPAMLSMKIATAAEQVAGNLF